MKSYGHALLLPLGQYCNSVFKCTSGNDVWLSTTVWKDLEEESGAPGLESSSATNKLKTWHSSFRPSGPQSFPLYEKNLDYVIFKAAFSMNSFVIPVYLR